MPVYKREESKNKAPLIRQSLRRKLHYITIQPRPGEIDPKETADIPIAHMGFYSRPSLFPLLLHSLLEVTIFFPSRGAQHVRHQAQISFNPSMAATCRCHHKHRELHLHTIALLR